MSIVISHLFRSRDDSAVAALRPPPELDVDDAESVVVVVVQSALQTAQLVLLGHLWTVQEAVNHIVASMPRCDAALHWRLELHDGTPLDPDELVGVLDFAPMDTLYIETVDEMLEPDYVAVSRALLRSLVLECDGMLNLPSNSASTTPRTSSDQYGFVPRSSGESSATSASAFDAEFDAILDTVALDLDDDDAPSPTTPQSPARTTSSGSGQYGWIGSVRETPKPMSAEARQVRRKLRQTVTRSRMVLKAEHLIDAPVERRSRDLALRATPAHYLRAPPRSNDAIDSHAPPVRPRGPPPKKPVMQTRKKRVKAASPLAAIMSAPPSEPTQPPPVARPGQPPRPTLSSSPLHAPAPVARPVSPAAPPPVARPASLDAYQSPRSGAPVTPTRRGPRVAAATTAAIVARPPISPAAAASPVRPASRPGATAKPLPAPPSGANSAKPHRPTAPPPRTTAAATLPSSFRAPSPLPRPAAPAAATLVYSNLPPSSSSSGDGYDNLPAHTLRIQRANMGLAPEDEGLEIEVFDDSLLSQLQQ